MQPHRPGAEGKQGFIVGEGGEGVLAHRSCVLVVALCKGIAEGRQQTAQSQRMQKAARLYLP